MFRRIPHFRDEAGTGCAELWARPLAKGARYSLFLQLFRELLVGSVRAFDFPIELRGSGLDVRMLNSTVSQVPMKRSGRPRVRFAPSDGQPDTGCAGTDRRDEPTFHQGSTGNRWRCRFWQRQCSLLVRSASRRSGDPQRAVRKDEPLPVVERRPRRARLLGEPRQYARPHDRRHRRSTLHAAERIPGGRSPEPDRRRSSLPRVSTSTRFEVGNEERAIDPDRRPM